MGRNMIQCGACKHEDNKNCVLKNIKVKPHKKKRCKDFELDETRGEVKHPLPITRVSCGEVEERRRQSKENLKKLKEQIRQQEEAKKPQNKYINPDRLVSYGTGTGNSKHPLTGDLSRFTTTVDEKEEK